MQTQTEDKWQNAREQAQAKFEAIKEMVEALERDEASAGPDGDVGESGHDARERILEDTLNVEVRSGWYMAACNNKDADSNSKPAEYRILLCTGGPAVQIQGELSEHGEPETARLMMQDWGLPWTEYRPHSTEQRSVTIDDKAEEILITYARQFYFGE